MAINILALDLERTLISDAYNREPRPGLYPFLEYCCASFPRLVLFTAVSPRIAREVLEELQRQGFVPATFFAKVEYLVWTGEYKDLRMIAGASWRDAVIVDDDEGWIQPAQRSQWIRIAEYDPYLVRGEDRELDRVQRILEERIKMRR